MGCWYPKAGPALRAQGWPTMSSLPLEQPIFQQTAGDNSENPEIGDFEPSFVWSFVAGKHVLMAPSLLFTTHSLPTGAPSRVCTQNPAPEFFIRWLNCKLEQLTILKTVQSMFCRRVILCWGDLRRCLARSRPYPPRPLPRNERCLPHDPLRRPHQHPEPSLQQQP